MADDPNFVDTTSGFFDQHPILGGLLSATPWGSRIVSALGTLTAIQQHQAQMAQQKALEGQLSSIGDAENAQDPYSGLDLLGQLDTKGFRPDAFRAMTVARNNLTSRAAAQAAANAKVMESAGTSQDIPYSPDRADRAGLAPPPGITLDDYQGTPPSSVPDKYSGLMLNQSTTPTPRAMDKSGMTAATAQITPPTYRPARTEEEMREALNDRDRALYYQATNFRGTPPDTSIAQIHASGHTITASTPEELDSMMQGLEAQYNALPEDQQKAMAGRLQTARSTIAIAKKNPKAMSRAIGTVENFQSSLEKGAQQSRQALFQQQMFDERKREFDTNLSRIDQQIKTGQVQNAQSEIDSLERAIQDMPGQIRFLQMDAANANLVASMQSAYIEMLRKVNYYRERLGGEIAKPTPSPATGAGPKIDRTPTGPVTPPGTQPAVPVGRGVPPPGTPRTKTLRSGKTVVIEEVAP